MTTAAMRATVRPRIELVSYLVGLAGAHKKKFCFPSQDWIREHYSQETGHPMSRRTLNRQLAGLVRDGYIERVRRHRRSPIAARGFEMRSTLYKFTVKAMRLVWRAAGAVREAVKWGRSRVTTLSQYFPLQGKVITAGAHSGAPPIDRSPPDGGGSGKKPDTHLAQSYLQQMREVLRRGR